MMKLGIKLDKFLSEDNLDLSTVKNKIDELDLINTLNIIAE